MLALFFHYYMSHHICSVSSWQLLCIGLSLSKAWLPFPMGYNSLLYLSSVSGTEQLVNVIHKFTEKMSEFQQCFKDLMFKFIASYLYFISNNEILLFDLTVRGQ
jgi:hypothetical protein